MISGKHYTVHRYKDVPFEPIDFVAAIDTSIIGVSISYKSIYQR